MARIDSILSIANQQGCAELRVGTDREPKMLANGTTKPLHLPATKEDMLRDLLGDILSAEREQMLRERGRVDVAYTSDKEQAYRVTLTARPDGGFDAVFLRGEKPAPPVREEPRVERPPAAPPAFAHDLLARAVAAGATDLHLLDGELPMMRVDGKLQPLDDAPTADAFAALGLDGVITSGESLEQTVALDDGLRARVHVYRAATGTAAAVRFLRRTPTSLGSLNLPIPLEDVVDIPHGLVIVCGATGSGKSTTLAALAQEALRRRSIVLVTLEQPIEYVLTGGSSSIVRQRQVGRDVGDFAEGLRDALREDPDVLLVGEMRDPETIALALTAAETGHLVIATLHSGSAAAAIDRIVDAYPPERQGHIRAQVADVLRVVVAQRLVPRARGNGRLPVVEVLRVNHAAASLIREGKTPQLANVLQSGRREGMISLERCLADRVNAGEVRQEHARAAANDAAAFTMYLGK
jgi:twitching motility protein PilT